MNIPKYAIARPRLRSRKTLLLRMGVMEESTFFFGCVVGISEFNSSSVDVSSGVESVGFFLSPLGGSLIVADAKTSNGSMVNPTILMTQPKPRFVLLRRRASMIGQTRPPIDDPPITVPIARPR